MGRTFEALNRAAKKYESNRSRESSHENIESLLVKIGLGEEQILEQNFSQLRKSFNRVDFFIKNPQSFFKLQTDKNESSKIPDHKILLKTLIDRKSHILGCFDILVTQSKLKVIFQLIGKMSDDPIKLAIEKKIDDLRAKDNFLIKEYGKLAHLEMKLEE